MNHPRAARAPLALVLVLAAPALAQRPPPAPTAASAPTVRPNPPGLSFTVSTANNTHRFRQGERIPLVLQFSATRSATWRLDGALYDRSGRLMIDQYRVEPAANAPDPVGEYFELGGEMGGLRQMPVLTATPVRIARDLNEYVRFDRPGRYTVVVETDRVESDQGRVPLRSQAIELELVAAEPAWAEGTLTQALATLDRPGSTDDTEGVSLAARTLRYLGTERAAMEMARRLPTERRPGVRFQMTLGLVGSPHRAAAVTALERVVDDPSTPITQDVFRTLALLQDLQSRTERMTPYPGDSNPAARAQWNERSRRVSAHRVETMTRLSARLAESVSRRTAAARPDTVHTLLEMAWTAQPPPAWFASLSAQLPQLLPDMDAPTQSRLLEHYWLRVRSPALLPFLRARVEAANTPVDLRVAALRRLLELAPAEGRAVILRELRQSPYRLEHLSRTALTLLPAEPIPELDEVLIAGIERRDYEADLRAVLLARYASPAVRARVPAILATPEGSLGHEAIGALLAYLLRADRAAGAAELRRRLSLGPSGIQQLAYVLPHVGASFWSPEVEAAAVTVLADERSPIAGLAAETLAKYGSSAARNALVQRLQAWRQAWTPRRALLTRHVASENPHEEDARLEYTLVDSISRARGFLLDAASATMLTTGCLTEMACESATNARRSALEPPTVTVFLSDDGGVHAMVAQYQFDTIEELRHKLAQYPSGTSVAISLVENPTASPRAPALRAELTSFLQAHGMTSRPSP